MKGPRNTIICQLKIVSSIEIHTNAIWSHWNACSMAVIYIMAKCRSFPIFDISLLLNGHTVRFNLFQHNTSCFMHCHIQFHFHWTMQINVQVRRDNNKLQCYLNMKKKIRNKETSVYSWRETGAASGYAPALWIFIHIRCYTSNRRM